MCSTVNVCINTCILTVHQCCLQRTTICIYVHIQSSLLSVELLPSDGKTSANLCVHSVPDDVSQVIIALVNKVKCKTGNRNPDMNLILAYSYLCWLWYSPHCFLCLYRPVFRIGKTFGGGKHPPSFSFLATDSFCFLFVSIMDLKLETRKSVQCTGVKLKGFAKVYYLGMCWCRVPLV